MNNSSFKNKFINISHLIQNEFDRNAAKYGEKIKCKEGCSMCCSQIFRITKLDAYIIKDYMNSQPQEFVSLLKSKATVYIDSQKNVVTDEFEYSRSKLNPCPALDSEGSCMIYDSRPVICRRFGPPVYDYKNPERLFACELNFSEGEEIIDDELIPAQTSIGKNWDLLKTEFNEYNKFNSVASDTIAEAILK